MSGGSLTTKGLISDGGSAPPATAVTPPPPTPEAITLQATTPTGTVMIIVPTAINTILLATENIVDNLRLFQPANTVLPSMYKRAYFIAYETDETAIVKPPA